MDDALCGGGDPDEGISNMAVPLSASAVNMIKAAIFMGDPRYISGLSYEVGTCRAGGVWPPHTPCLIRFGVVDG
jgi:acetylxylan esterase